MNWGAGTDGIPPDFKAVLNLVGDRLAGTIELMRWNRPERSYLVVWLQMDKRTTERWKRGAG